MAAEIEPGSIVAERYRVTRLLGEGGMGAVWAAQHIVTRKTVALKLMKAAGAAKPELVRRFLREARAASAVRHPNVVQIHDILQTTDGMPVMVMDLLEGESLGSRLERESVLSLADVSAILLPVISAIGTAHSLGIVHRDLKPDNIFLVREGHHVRPCVLDFGIAKLSAMEGDAAQTGALTRTGAMMGTPYYMAPEQAFGEKSLDLRADVWAIGVILYECLTGRRPVDGDNMGQLLKILMTGAVQPIEELKPDLPPEVIDLVRRMLTTDLRQRLPSLHHAYDVLAHHAGTVSASSFGQAAAPRTFSEEAVGSVAPPPGDAANTDAVPGIDPFGSTTSASSSDSQVSATSAVRARKRTMLAAVGAVALVALGSLGLFLQSRSSMRSTSAPSAPSSATVAATAVPAPSADATASASAAAAPSAEPSATNRASSPKGGEQRKATPVPATASDPSPRALPGKMLEKAPF